PGAAWLFGGHSGRWLRHGLPDERLLAPAGLGVLRPGAALGRAQPATARPDAAWRRARPRRPALHRPALPGPVARPPAALRRHARKLRDHAPAGLGLAPLRGRGAAYVPSPLPVVPSGPLRRRWRRRLARVPRPQPRGRRGGVWLCVLPRRAPAGAGSARDDGWLPPWPARAPPRRGADGARAAGRRPVRPA